ncbi:phage tail tape measure protein [Hoylesella buccalis]|uniref:phage tail tape measure protein n=1 Tax=Hoylesella buccalis TaxID=28127 RepID=UPI0026EDD20C|nr:phage tail tape measure protein [Hoylesella buccalis]
MARNTQEFETVVRLNAQQAKDELKTMQERLDELKRKKDTLLSGKDYDAKDLRTLNKEIRQQSAAIRAFGSSVQDTIHTLSNLDKASLGELQKSVRNLRRQMANVTNEEEFRQLDALMQKANARILELKGSAGEAATETRRVAEAAKTVNAVLADVNGASLAELRTAAAAIREEMEKTKPDTKAYQAHAENLKKVTNRIQEVNERQKQVNLTIDKYDKEIRQITKDQAVVARENKVIDQTLRNLSGATMRDLEYALQMVNEQLRETSHGTKAFDELAEKSRRLKKQIADVNDQLKAPVQRKGLVSGFIDGLNKNWGAIVQGWAALTGLTQTVRMCTNAFASMEDVMANTRKYTGQTDEQVREMNEDFKKMDTRSSREQLNELAGAAGRLGITSKEGIEEFVDAADKISVALGDDLGDKAVDQIGKLTMAFGEDQRMGLRGAMLATGSAINELAQNSSAQANYLVEFTARVAGIGKQFGLTQTQIMGFGAVLDENMQKDEMAATAFSQLLTKMTTNTKKFANIAGIEVGKFSKMLKEDANGAVLTLLESLKKKGDFQVLAKMFQEMGLDGTRATGVLTTLADKIDLVKKRQQLANDAYRQGKSVIDEFDVQNSTVQANLDKAKKSFHELTIELGEKLLPIAKYGVTTASFTVKALSELINFSTKYWKVLVPLGAAIATYTLLLKLNAFELEENKVKKMWHIVKDIYYTTVLKAKNAQLKISSAVYALLTRKISLATAAQTLLNKVVKANPYVAAATAMAALTSVIIAFISKTDKAAEAQKELNKVNAEAATQCRSEIVEMSSLVKVAKDKSASDAARMDAIKKLQEKYPGYLDNLSLENIYSQNAATSIANLTNMILDQAKARILLAKVEEIQRKKEEMKKEYLESWWGAAWHSLKASFEASANNWKNIFKGTDYVKGKDGSLQVVEHKRTINDQVKIDLNADLKELEKKQKIFEKEYQMLQKKIETANAKIAAELEKKNKEEADKEEKERKEEERKRKAALQAQANAEHKREALQRKQEALRKKNLKDAIQAQKALTDAELVENYRKYAQGEIDLRTFRKKEKDIKMQSLDEQIRINGAESEEAKALLRKKEELLMKYNDDVRRMTEEEIRYRHDNLALQLQSEYEQKGKSLYQNQEALNEALYQNELDALMERQQLYNKGTQEYLDLQAEIEQREGMHKIENARHYQELLSQLQEEYGKKDVDKQKALAVNRLKWMERYELQQMESLYKGGELKHEEYEQRKTEITTKYAQYRNEVEQQFEWRKSEQNLNDSKGEKFKRRVDRAHKTAANNAKADYQNDHPDGQSVTDYFTSDIVQFSSVMENIRQMEANGVISHQEAMAAMGQATADMVDQMGQKFQMAYEAITPIMNAMSSYYAAQSDYEQKVTQQKYDRMIKHAGKNATLARKIEDKKQKELAKIKTKYARKEANMQVAQAIAQTALGAVSAYASVMRGIPAPANLVMAPIAAGLAIAAGAIQIATIKKQQQAQEAGYYEGGFTGGSDYRRKAGIVHQGEFVANHRAVNNPQLLPALRLIDKAQRNNTIGMLTAADVSQSLGTGTTVVSAPTVNVQTDNAELSGVIGKMNDTLDRMGALLDGGITAHFSMHDFKKEERHWDQLQQNK